ncbi:MAG: hypothetical protein P8M16_09455 [Acidimicrobiales bacterium]|nr:hypothetical protein [Acidimicrobiales bacterium]
MTEMQARRGQMYAGCMAVKVGVVVVHLFCPVVLWTLSLVVERRRPPIPASMIGPVKRSPSEPMATTQVK